MPTIKFGTSGWRAIIAEDFTFANVALATAAIAGHLQGTGRTQNGVLVAHDPRFQGRAFARCACEVLAAAGIKAFLCKDNTPTPVVAFEQIRRQLDGAINFTASHNPPEYGGLKFNPYWGGPATKEITKDIEARAAGIQTAGAAIAVLKFDEGVKKGLVEGIDPTPAYFKRIRELVDFKAIKKARLKIVADPLFGAGRGYLETLLKGSAARLDVLHAGLDALFGGGNPEPAEGHIDEMQALVKKSKAHIGLGLDGDADRFGIVDSDGTFIVPNLVIALLVRHLSRTRKWSGPVIRSVTSSH
jgi:phosphoglucomutase